MAIRDYLYIDRERLVSYLEQTGEPETLRLIKEGSLEVSLAGLKMSGKQSQQYREWTDHEAINEVEELLFKVKDVDFQRPISHTDADNNPRHFVIETTTFTKVVLPIPKEARLDLRELVLWCSEPNFSDYDPSLPRWEAQGTFLVLIAHPSSADGNYSGTWSGHSALHALLSQVRRDCEDKFRYLNEKRKGPKPIELLREIGGHVLEPRLSKTLYKKRAITNEQYYFIDAEERRSNLLIGYPLYIREVRSTDLDRDIRR